MSKFLAGVLALGLAGTLLAGCTEYSSFTREYAAWGTGSFPVANDGQAALYIVREAGPGATTPIEITIGSQSLVNIVPPDYVRLDLDPRLYDLRAFGPSKNKELVITVAPIAGPAQWREPPSTLISTTKSGTVSSKVPATVRNPTYIACTPPMTPATPADRANAIIL